MQDICLHHQSHESRIIRTEEDVQRLYTTTQHLDAKISEQAVGIAKIVGGIAAIGTIAQLAIAFYVR